MSGVALQSALRLGENGICCFPVLANKAPACPGGLKAATRDSNELHELWRKYPAPLVGVPTGEKSGFDALDLDLAKHRQAREWWDENRARIHTTRTHRTRSGGLHLLFRRHSGLRNSASRLAAGIDVRAGGGFVVWWPAAGLAVDAPTSLSPWPSWLLSELLPPTPAPSRPAVFSSTGDGATRRYALAALRNAIERVASAREGVRNHALNVECFSLSRFIPDTLGAEEVAEALAIAARCAGLSCRETAATIASALRAGGRSA